MYFTLGKGNRTVAPAAPSGLSFSDFSVGIMGCYRCIESKWISVLSDVTPGLVD